ncbi:MAG TPA: hypothetical protein VL404_07755 [Candidatus Eisenbacteria bacterium]|nr:hypothetical protein [Candidatus Eisenbacteria bacterium]
MPHFLRKAFSLALLLASLTGGGRIAGLLRPVFGSELKSIGSTRLSLWRTDDSIRAPEVNAPRLDCREFSKKPLSVKSRLIRPSSAFGSPPRIVDGRAEACIAVAGSPRLSFPYLTHAPPSFLS